MTAFYPMYSYSNYALPNGVEPLVVSDFKNAIYQISGANCVITDIWEEDTDFGNYSPSDVVANVGLVATGGGPILKPTLAADPITNGYTVIMQVLMGTSSDAPQIASVYLPPFTQELEAWLAYDNVADKLKANVNAPGGGGSGPSNLPYPARYKMGVSIIGTDIFMSVAGTAVISSTHGVPSTLNTIAIYGYNTVDTPVELWALYPFQDPSSLDELTAA